MRKYQRAPHPFVIAAPLLADGPPEGDGSFAISFRLFGPACASAPFCLRAFGEAARRGFSKSRVPFRLAATEVRRGDGRMAPPEGDAPVLLGPPEPWPEHVRLSILTPLRMKHQGRMVTPQTFSAGIFAMAVVRRFGLLSAFYGNDERGAPDFPALKREAEAVGLSDARLEWHSLYRHSSRQGARQSISGLLGEVGLDLSAAPALRRILAWAPVIHVGKGTSMGLGRVMVAR